MKKLKLLILLCSLLMQVSFAQAEQPPKPASARRLEALKIAYVTKQLSLTPDEAEKFWPVYHAYIGEVRKTRQQLKGGDVLELEESILNLRKKYRIEFRKVLVTDDRVTKALTLERDFNNMVRKELQQRMETKKQQQ